MARDSNKAGFKRLADGETPSPLLGRWFSTLSKQWVEVFVVGQPYASVRGASDGRPAFQLHVSAIEQRIERGEWVREIPQ